MNTVLVYIIYYWKETQENWLLTFMYVKDSYAFGFVRWSFVQKDLVWSRAELILV
jgi:hypothetical protein